MKRFLSVLSGASSLRLPSSVSQAWEPPLPSSDVLCSVLFSHVLALSVGIDPGLSDRLVRFSK